MTANKNDQNKAVQPKVVWARLTVDENNKVVTIPSPIHAKTEPAPSV